MGKPLRQSLALNPDVVCETSHIVESEPQVNTCEKTQQNGLPQTIVIALSVYLAHILHR